MLDIILGELGSNNAKVFNKAEPAAKKNDTIIVGGLNETGIIGLPNVGKSTLFKAITGTQAEIANYPFCTINPNISIVPVPDRRLDHLCQLYQPERCIPAVLEVVDIAGLVRGASKGEGLGNQFLSSIREVDAIIHVVRCFEGTNIAHVDAVSILFVISKP